MDTGALWIIWSYCFYTQTKIGNDDQKTILGNLAYKDFLKVTKVIGMRTNTFQQVNKHEKIDQTRNEKSSFKGPTFKKEDKFVEWLDSSVILVSNGNWTTFGLYHKHVWLKLNDPVAKELLSSLNQPLNFLSVLHPAVSTQLVVINSFSDGARIFLCSIYLYLTEDTRLWTDSFTNHYLFLHNVRY